MSIFYVDLVNGDDTTGTGLSGNPFLTMNKAVGEPSGPHELRIAKTPDPTTLTASVSWAYGSVDLTTDTDLTSALVIGDYIGKPSAAGNGNEETYYRINTIDASTMTLDRKYIGTTEAVSAIKNIPIVTTGSAGANAASIGAGTEIIGGWDLVTNSPSGESWIKSNNNRTAAYAVLYVNASTTGVTLQKLNLVETYRPLYMYYAGNSQLYDMTILGYYHAIERSNVMTGSILKRMLLCSTVSHVWDCYGYNLIFEDSVILGSGSYGIYNVGSNFLSIKNNKFYNTSSWAISTGNNKPIEGPNYFYECYGGVLPRGNQVIKRAYVYNASYGIHTQGQSGAVYVSNCYFENCNYGFSGNYNHGSEVANSTFEGCDRGVYVNEFSGSVTVRDCIFNAPITSAVERHVRAGNAHIIGCTIDNASIAKGYIITSPGYYPQVQYTIENSFGQNGKIWGAGSKMIDNDTYRTTAPSLALTWNATSTYNNTPMKLMSTMINPGSAKTFSMYIKSSNSSWAGEIVPKWRLNGTVIKTETPSLTSLPTSWTQYSWTTESNLLTASGELSLEFVPNMNTYAINIDDFEVT